nr:hypothetical protein [Streptococcus equi]
MSENLLSFQGLARPAHASFGVTFSQQGQRQFGTGMSLSEAIQSRKSMAQPARAASKPTPLPFGPNAATSKQAIDWQIGDIAHHKKWGAGTV